MSDYSKITNFLSKDSLSLNDPAKYVKGSEIDAEYNAIAVAIATKADTASPTLVTPNIGAATGTSLALGGGTALTTTNRTGTGNLVLANAPTLTGLTVSGGNFASRGISDTATAAALSLSGSGANSVTIANSATTPTIGTSTGGLLLASGGLSVVLLTASASAVNLLTLNAAATGAAPYIYANGSDANVNLGVYAKGTGGIIFATEGSATTQVQINHTASANRYITLTGSNGGNPTIGTSAGNLVFAPAGLRAVSVEAPASTVNYLSLSGAATGGACVIRPNSDVDTNIGLTLDSKGSGQITFRTDPYGTPAIQAAVQHTASANRYITLTGSNGGNPTIDVSAGNLAITPQLNLTSNLHVGFSTAIGAGGVGNPVIALSASSLWICCGSGAPGISAAKGSLYLRSDGSTTNNRMYVNTDGGTTWTAVTTAA